MPNHYNQMQPAFGNTYNKVIPIGGSYRPQQVGPLAQDQQRAAQMSGSNQRRLGLGQPVKPYGQWGNQMQYGGQGSVYNPRTGANVQADPWGTSGWRGPRYQRPNPYAEIDGVRIDPYAGVDFEKMRSGWESYFGPDMYGNQSLYSRTPLTQPVQLGGGGTPGSRYSLPSSTTGSVGTPPSGGYSNNYYASQLMKKAEGDPVAAEGEAEADPNKPPWEGDPTDMRSSNYDPNEYNRSHSWGKIRGPAPGPDPATAGWYKPEDPLSHYQYKRQPDGTLIRVYRPGGYTEEEQLWDNYYLSQMTPSQLQDAMNRWTKYYAKDLGFVDNLGFETGEGKQMWNNEAFNAMTNEQLKALLPEFRKKYGDLIAKSGIQNVDALLEHIFSTEYQGDREQQLQTLISQLGGNKPLLAGARVRGIFDPNFRGNREKELQKVLGILRGEIQGDFLGDPMAYDPADAAFAGIKNPEMRRWLQDNINLIDKPKAPVQGMMDYLRYLFGESFIGDREKKLNQLLDQLAGKGAY